MSILYDSMVVFNSMLQVLPGDPELDTERGKTPSLRILQFILNGRDLSFIQTHYHYVSGGLSVSRSANFFRSENC